MPKAATTPAMPDLQPAIACFREIAADSGDRLLLGDGPPHPDAALLDLCAEIAHQRKIADTAYRFYMDGYPRYWAAKAAHAARKQASHTASRSFAHLLRRATKMRATTAAGIYAKAIAVRASYKGAAMLAMSLADDLIASPGLRTSLWPTGDMETTGRSPT